MMRKVVIIICFAFSLCIHNYAQSIPACLTVQEDDSTDVLTQIINFVRDKAVVDLYKKAHLQADSLDFNHNDSLSIENAAIFFQSLKFLNEFEETLLIVFNRKARAVINLTSNKIQTGKLVDLIKIIKFDRYINKHQELPREQYEYLVYRYTIKTHGREIVDAMYIINVDENGELIVLHREIIMSD